MDRGKFFKKNRIRFRKVVNYISVGYFLFEKFKKREVTTMTVRDFCKLSNENDNIRIVITEINSDEEFVGNIDDVLTTENPIVDLDIESWDILCGELYIMVCD